MRAIRFGLLLLALVLSCSDPSGPSSTSLLPIDVPWTEGQSVVCFGTSLTYGYLGWFEPPIGMRFNEPPVIPTAPAKASGTAEVDTISYPYHLGLRLRLPVYNEGIVGATTEDALQTFRDSVLSKNPALVLLEFSANDFLRSYDVASTDTRLRSLIDSLQAAGPTVVLISFINEEMMTVPPDHYMASRRQQAEAYLTMLRTVAADKGLLFVEWAMQGIYWDASLLSDGIHPNRAGYKIMADNIYRALQPTFERNGMTR